MSDAGRGASPREKQNRARPTLAIFSVSNWKRSTGGGAAAAREATPTDQILDGLHLAGVHHLHEGGVVVDAL